MKDQDRQVKTCEHCRWYHIAEGENDPPWADTAAYIDVAICTFNPPGNGPYPWSFGETVADAKCSKWEALDE